MPVRTNGVIEVELINLHLAADGNSNYVAL
jgi:hypothetical protein